MKKKDDKKKRLKKEQEHRKEYNKAHKVQNIVSYAQYYKQLRESDLSDTRWLEKKDDGTMDKISYVLNRLQATDILEMEYKWMEAVQAFVRQCEKLYTPVLFKNELLKKKARDTIVNYYRSEFEIRMSREISFLPLELRLYIYLELLKRETAKYHMVCILDRIMVTLNKMECGPEYENSVFLVSWAEYLLFLTSRFQPAYVHLGYEAFAKNIKFGDILQWNRNVTGQKILDARQKTMESAMVDEARKLDQEYWYGLNAFRNEDNINDLEAAEMCVHLFCDYFEKIFLSASEFRGLILKHYRTGNREKLDVFIKKHMLDEIDMKSYKMYMQDGIVQMVENKAEGSEIAFWGSKAPGQNSYFYLYGKDCDKARFFSCGHVPEKISPKEYYPIMEYLLEKLGTGQNVYLPNVEAYIVAVATAMLNSEAWNPYLLLYFLHVLQKLLYQMWELGGRDDLAVQCRTQLRYALLLKEEDIQYQGFGAPRAVYVTKKGAVAVCSDEFQEPFMIVQNIKEQVMGSTSEMIAFLKQALHSGRLEEAVMSDMYTASIFNPTVLSWRLYDQTLTKEQRRIRKSGWERIRQFHLSNGYHVPKKYIVDSLKTRLENASSHLEGSGAGDVRDELHEVLYIYKKYVVSRDFQVKYLEDMKDFIHELKKNGYRGKLLDWELKCAQDDKAYYRYLYELVAGEDCQ